MILQADNLRLDYVGRSRVHRLHGAFGSQSMIGKRLFTENIALAQYHLESNNLGPGSYVECGTWRGGLSFAMMQALPTIAEWHLFDSFEGLPTPTELDGKRAFDPEEIEHDNNTAHYDEFMTTLDQCVPVGPTTVHRGWFKDTVPNFRPDLPISVLRLDGDWYESIMVCLEAFFDQVQPNGLVILDDYDDWVGCRRAVHDFLSMQKAEESIQHSRRGVPYIVKA